MSGGRLFFLGREWFEGECYFRVSMVFGTWSSVLSGY